MSLRPINSIKHIVDIQGALTVGAKSNNVLVSSVESPTNAAAADVQQGGRVSSLFLNVQVNATSEAALGNAYFIIYKNPGNNIAPGEIPNANATGTSDFKKQIFHTEMAMLSDAASDIPIVLFKGVLKIPPRFQRMGIKDQILVQLFSPGVTAEYCIECIYKEYR